MSCPSRQEKLQAIQTVLQVQPQLQPKPHQSSQGRSPRWHRQLRGGQTRVVPRPSQPPQGALRDRSSSQGLAAKEKAEPKKEVAPEDKEKAGSPKRELKVTPKKEDTEEKKKGSSSTSSSSRRRRKKKEKKRREKEKKDRKRRRRSSSLGSSVTGSRVRDAKRKERKRLPTPPRPKSPHTPPGPPPDPPPAPTREPSRPPLRRGRGRGWIGPIPWSSHPRWHTATNKGITKRAKQEKYNDRWW